MHKNLDVIEVLLDQQGIDLIVQMVIGIPIFYILYHTIKDDC